MNSPKILCTSVPQLLHIFFRNFDGNFAQIAAFANFGAPIGLLRIVNSPGGAAVESHVGGYIIGIKPHDYILPTVRCRDGSISLFEFRYDIDTIFAKYRDIEIAKKISRVK